MLLVFRAVTMSLAAMGNVTLVVLIYFLIFGIMGVNLYNGRFYFCNDSAVASKVGPLCGC